MKLRRAIGAATSGTLLLLAASTALGSFPALQRWIAAQRLPQVEAPAGWPAPRYDTPIARAGFELGRRLFYDPRLSKDGTISCASCHQQFAAFAHFDHRVSHGVGGVNGTRNAPALFNLAWRDELMWDGAISHLDLQPLAPLLNPLEMAATLPAVLETLQRDADYPAQFERAYGSAGIDSQRMLGALAQFMAPLVSADSRYDRHLQGKESFSADESAGLAVFRTRCAACHNEPLFSDQSYRSNGLQPSAIDQSVNAGRAAVTGRAADRGLFRVPSLRNLGYSAPYMHDGRYATLAAVLDHYAGVFGSAGDADPLLRKQAALSADERTALLAFLQTLDDPGFVDDPRFAEPPP